eukprot:scaffold83429_cov25-Cyclotella_meneghiniana.AAC.1
MDGLSHHSYMSSQWHNNSELFLFIFALGLLGYIQLCLTAAHVLPGQFLKRYVKSDDEAAEAANCEEQKGVVICFISGLLPCTYRAIWILCGPYGGVDGLFVAYLFAVMYMMLVIRWLLAHSLVYNSDSISL